MKYLKRFNEEVLINFEERKRFLEDVEITFINNVVDNSKLIELPSGEEFIEGFYYLFHDFYMSLDLDNPFLKISIWCDENYITDMINLENLLERFFKNIRNFGYKCSISLTDVEVDATGKSTKECLEAYTDFVYYETVNSDTPFEIKIYYL